MHEIYLDNHTATKPHDQLVDQMAIFLKSYWASPSSPHRLGQQGYLPSLTSIRKLYDLIGACEGDSFYLHSSLSDAVSDVLLSTYQSLVKESGKSHFYTSEIEDSHFLLMMKKMDAFGCSLKTLKVNRFGQLTKQSLEEGLRPRAAMLSLTWANGLTGVIHPIEDIIEVCKKKQVMIHLDVSSVVGKHYFRFEDLAVDYLTLDGSLIHAPKGSVGTFAKMISPLTPFALDSSTENTCALLSLAESLELAAQNFDHLCTETARLRDRFESSLLSLIPDIVIPFAEAERLPNTSVICFDKLSNEALLYLLNTKGIYASIGGGRYQKLSHILQVFGIDKRLAFGSMSFSLSSFTTEEEIDTACQLIADCVKELRNRSSEFFKEN